MFLSKREFRISQKEKAIEKHSVAEVGIGLFVCLFVCLFVVGSGFTIY